MQNLLVYFRRFLRHKTRLLLGLGAIPLAQYADIYVTLLVGDALNRVDREGTTDWLPAVLGWMAAAALAHCVFRFWQRWLIVVVSRDFEVELKQELFDKLTSLPFSFHNRSRSGDVVSRLTSDVENLRMFLGPGLMYTLGALVIVPISLYYLAQLNAPLAAVMCLPLVGMALVMKLLSGRLHKHSMAVQESLADISHRAQENFGGIRVVQGYHRQDQQDERFADSSETNRANQVLLAKARGLTHSGIWISFELTFVAILVMGGLAALDRSLALGDLFKFVDLTMKVFWPLIALGWIAGMYPRAVASSERVTELLGTVPDIADAPDAVELERPEGALELRDVTFRHGPETRPALRHVSVRVPAGRTLGVVGPTGSGKTTLLLLLGRLFDVSEGAVLLDGHDVRELTLASLRRNLGYVPQDSFLFSDTYADNVRFGADRELSDAEVDDLIARAAMTDEVARFPEGKETLIGERGVTLSGGQRQRTCIARALARDPKVLILDDCLSAVDTETERELLGSLRGAGQGRTVVVAAHRLSTVVDADHVLVLGEDGSVVDQGTHAELLDRPGWYRTTWDLQQRREALVSGVPVEVAPDQPLGAAGRGTEGEEPAR